MAAVEVYMKLRHKERVNKISDRRWGTSEYYNNNNNNM